MTNEQKDAWSTLGIVGIIVVGMVALSLFCSGCVSENTGSSTIVGEQLALPEISDASDNISVRVYESIKGARVWTAKDSRVTINYTNVYTNTYFGIVETRDFMNLAVEIEPLEVGGAATSPATTSDDRGTSAAEEDAK